MSHSLSTHRISGTLVITLAGCLVPIAATIAGAAAQGSEPVGAAADKPSLVFDAANVDVGETYELGIIEQEFPVVNRGERAVRIVEVQTDDPRAVIEHPDRVDPGAKAVVRVVRPLEPSRLGVQRFRFVVHSDDVVRPVQPLELRTFVQSAYDVEHPFVDFGEVERSRGATRIFEMSTREAEKLALVRVASSPDSVLVRPAQPVSATSPQTVRLEFTMAPGAPLGSQNGVVHIQTDLARQRDYFVRFQAAVFGDVVPDECPIVWGAVRQGESVERTVRLISRSGKPFRVARLEDSGRLAATAVEPCTPPGAACQALRLTLDTVRRGGIKGELRVFFDGDDEPLPLSFDGLVVSPDARIKDLGVVGQGTLVESYVGDESEGESRP